VKPEASDGQFAGGAGLSVTAPLTLGMSAGVLAVVASVVLATSRPKPMAVGQMQFAAGEPAAQLVR
jgi:hypothetical protein